MSARRLFVLAFALAGCGAASEPLTASPRDYSLYRRTRTATTSEGRLSASQNYLDQEIPEGRWRAEVADWFQKAEPLYYEKSQGSIAGLEHYLATLPRGPHAADATDKLAGVRTEKKLERVRDARLLDEAREVEDKLHDAAAMRRELVHELADWTHRLAAIRTFGQPTSALDSETIYHFRLEDPGGHCTEDRCIKELALPYAIPANKRLVPRKALMDVSFELYRGGVARARLAGPELWSRVSEASELRPVTPNDKEARAEAIARAVQIVSGALGPSFGGASCEREAVSPVVLLRECGGVRITMRAAPTPAEDDDLVVEPAAPSTGAPGK